MLTKVLFTVAAVVIVWWLFKAIQRRNNPAVPGLRPHERAAQAARDAVRASMERRGEGTSEREREAARVEDMEQCPACGTWKAKGEPCGCGRG